MRVENIYPSILSDLTHLVQPLASRAIRCRKDMLSKAYEFPLRRVNVLEGHTGCINTLSWANDGEVLLSGGDDTTVRVWRMNENQDDPTQEYPFVCNTEIFTGHTSNIFAAHILPFSSRLVTAARDRQVRVIDIENSSPRSVYERIEYSSRQNSRIIRCHSGAVKRIVSELSPDLFLTVSEDGSVRQHDLRVPTHNCTTAGECPTPLVKLRHQLFSLSLSSLAPYQFVVAGDAPHGYLFDRRHIGRFLQAEWGMPVDSDNMTTCVRRMGRRRKESRRRMDYITGTRMSDSGDEVILSYAGDAIYSFSTRDEPVERSRHSSPILTPDPKRRKRDNIDETMEIDMMDSEEIRNELSHTGDSDNQAEENDTDDDDDGGVESNGPESSVPQLLPKLRYAGISNIRTIKDVNFLGPNNEFVVSGSEDGNFFIWRRSTGELHGIYEGDSSVVNVVEGHPRLPLVAVSGLDHTVKVFGPGHGPSEWAKIGQAEAIMARNVEAMSVDPAFDIRTYLLRNYPLLVTSGSAEDEIRDRCNFQ